MKRIMVVIVIILSLVMGGCVESIPPEHNMKSGELDNHAYINYGDDLHNRICNACSEFDEHKPLRVKGEVDDVDLVIYLWAELQENDVKSILVLGDERDKQCSRWSECNDVWLIIMTPTGYIRVNIVPQILYGDCYYSKRTSAEVEECVSSYYIDCDSPGSFLVAERCAEIRKECAFERHDVSKDFSSRFHQTGFYYAKPSDIRDDIGDRDITVTYINRGK